MGKQIDYLDFEIRVGSSNDGSITVQVRTPDGAIINSRSIDPFTADQRTIVRQTITTATLRQTARVRSSSAPEAKAMKEFGRTLFDAVMSGPIKNTYYQSMGQATQQGKGMRVRLVVDPALNDLPWEFLCSPERDFIGLDPQTPIVRFIPQSISPSTLTAKLPLNVLVVIASPSDQSPLDTEAEKSRITTALQQLEAEGKVRLNVLEGAGTWPSLIEALRPDETHILHFIGHGSFEAEMGEGVLLFEDDSGESKRVGSEQMKILMRGKKQLRLVVLNSCLGTQASEAEPLASVAASLVHVGVPAVIAMQFEIGDDAAQKLAKTFYNCLAHNYPVDAALTEARRDIALLSRDSLEWATPVIYMQVANGQLFNLDQAPDATTPATVNSAPAQPVTAGESAATDSVDFAAIAAEQYKVGQDAEMTGEWVKAMAAYRGAILAVPGYKDASVRFGNCERRQQCRALYDQARQTYGAGDYDRALSTLSQVRALDPRWTDSADIQALSECGQIYLKAMVALRAHNTESGADLLRQVVTKRVNFKDAKARLDNMIQGGDGLLGMIAGPAQRTPPARIPSKPPESSSGQANVPNETRDATQLPQGQPAANDNARYYDWPSADPTGLVEHVRQWFFSQGYQVQSFEQGAALVIQGKKDSNLRKVFGTSAAATAVIERTDAGVKLVVGGAKWADKAAALGIGLFVFGLNFFTGLYGAGVQKMLLDSVWRTCDEFVVQNGGKRTL